MKRHPDIANNFFTRSIEGSIAVDPLWDFDRTSKTFGELFKSGAIYSPGGGLGFLSKDGADADITLSHFVHRRLHDSIRLEHP